MRPPAEDRREATFLDYVRAQIPAAPMPPATRGGWDRRLAAVRAGLARSLGRLPKEDCELAPEVLGTIVHEGVAIERLTFQSRPGVRVTANLYRPKRAEGKLPAVLSVHGHSAWARIDPLEQARCLGLAKLGYVTLAVDAFGAGERAVEPAAGTYHGALLGASLWPAGVPLLGLQVYDNRRAVDYLLTRPEVDPGRLAISGASGGGNQSMYAGATDPRFAAVVPVCGVGTLESYVGTGCCVCEVLVGGLTYATTGDLLALVAPRALLVINATQDAIQFSVGEARKSIEYARARYRLLDAEAKVRHLAVEAGHGYNKPMREALYGWLDRWLRGKGDGSPVAEPAHEAMDPAELRCYPDGPSRPKTIATIPAFATSEGADRLASLPPPADHRERFEADALWMRSTLREEVLGGFPTAVPPDVTKAADDQGQTALEITTEAGLRLRGRLLTPPAGRWQGQALLLRPEGIAPADDPLVKALLAARWRVLTVDLRATGAGKPPTNPTASVPDHNEAEWALWIGRPLLGQWAWDALRWLDVMAELDEPVGGRPASDLEPGISRNVLVGLGPFSLVALVAAALDLDETADGVAAVRGPISFLGEGPWAKWLMGVVAANILDVGDVGRLAALAAPRQLMVIGGVEPDGTPVSKDRLRTAFADTRAIYKALKAERLLTVSDADDLPTLLAAWDD